MKRLKISQVLNRDWKRELLTYLSMYYSTPHSTTGKTPAELMFGRNIRTKLPTLRDLSTEAPPTEYRDRDLQQKEKGKVTEDLRRRAKPSELNVGDEVYMKNVLPGNKLTPTFNPKVMTVAAKQGSRVTVQNNETGKSYDRNSSHLKKVVFGNSGIMTIGIITFYYFYNIFYSQVKTTMKIQMQNRLMRQIQRVLGICM